ncbi:uncharacterized protein LOC131878712 isoform X2 [Tigriopus californicus]|uniref:uncharacterized protein LOC131878712 isoform X2 n=1 Tax=Tigriopus californicus TaxID=6832 RepID=UPI0027DAA946|nr:uncharacterized protein LOC131878712 isoform X2 [Tigriopus californicus]
MNEDNRITTSMIRRSRSKETISLPVDSNGIPKAQMPSVTNSGQGQVGLVCEDAPQPLSKASTPSSSHHRSLFGAAKSLRSKSSSNLLALLRPNEEDSQFLIRLTGLSKEHVEEKFRQFASITNSKPDKLYQRAFPASVQPWRLASSLFRMVDKDHDGVLYFREFFIAFCKPTPQISVSTQNKFRTLFHIWDHLELGYLTPGSVALIMKDVFDILGLSSDYHHEAIELFSALDTDKDCRVFEGDFVRGMMTNAKWVHRMETCNFCVPPEDIYLGQSAFWEN